MDGCSREDCLDLFRMQICLSCPLSSLLTTGVCIAKEPPSVNHCLDHLNKFVTSKEHRITLIRTDNEFIQTQCLDFCHNNPSGRIELQGCIPYEHGQIGEVERSHRTLQDSTVKALHNKPHLEPKCWGMAYLDCLFKHNSFPKESLANRTPISFWDESPVDLLTTPYIPFGSIVMAHIPVELQTVLGGRSFRTYSVGCAPNHKGGLLLFNPQTKRYIIRRTFKILGPQ